MKDWNEQRSRIMIVGTQKWKGMWALSPYSSQDKGIEIRGGKMAIEKHNMFQFSNGDCLE